MCVFMCMYVRFVCGCIGAQMRCCMKGGSVLRCRRRCTKEVAHVHMHVCVHVCVCVCAIPGL